VPQAEVLRGLQELGGRATAPQLAAYLAVELPRFCWSGSAVHRALHKLEARNLVRQIGAAIPGRSGMVWEIVP
jgi:hypothetical protein